MRLIFVAQTGWPPLTWLACLTRGGDKIRVLHGSRVETRPEWFCEAVWDGAFAEGEFDRSNVVFGSGGRVREDEVRFVGPATTLDRLHSFERGDQVWVSNSLVCLMAAIGAKGDPVYERYVEDFGTISKGIEAYKRGVHTTAGDIRLTYYRNLAWDGAHLREIDKPEISGGWTDFAEYYAFMTGTLKRLAANLRDDDRRRRYELLGTTSSGYDSLAVTCLARECGLREVFSLRKGRHGMFDSGEANAKKLGLEVHLLDRGWYLAEDGAEIPFLAADGKGEDIFLGAAGELLDGRVLLTGYCGDKIWSVKPWDATPVIRRRERSGLSLGEYRLWRGFLHITVPFIGIRRIEDVVRISQSEEMKPWDYSHVTVGDGYSRPIPRRIIESQGIRRDEFATAKKASTVLFSGVDSLAAGTRAEYLAWLRQKAHLWRERDCDPPYPLPMRRWGAALVNAGVGGVLYGVSRINPRRLEMVRKAAVGLKKRSRDGIERYLFPWAIEKAKERYAVLDSGMPAEREFEGVPALGT